MNQMSNVEKAVHVSCKLNDLVLICFKGDHWKNMHVDCPALMRRKLVGEDTKKKLYSLNDLVVIQIA